MPPSDLSLDSTAAPPPSVHASIPDRESWIIDQITGARSAAKEALKVASEARDIATETRDDVREVREAIGQSPDKARGIEGKGFLGSLSAQIEAREDEKKTRATIRLLLAGAVSALTVASIVVGLLKALGLLH